MKRVFTAVKALVFMSGFVTLWGWIALRVRILDADLGMVLPWWTAEPGLLMIGAGAWLALSCVALFVLRGQGTPAPFDPPRRFVAVGPYRYVRNPMYLGAFLVMLGFGLYLHSAAIVLFGIVWLIPAHLFVVLYEEPTLAATFGAEYDEYRREVSRWMPKVARPQIAC